MFIEKSNESDFWTSLESGMNQNASFDNNLRQEQINKALAHLQTAAESLKTAGMKKEAQMVTTVQEACGDPHTEGLTSEQMLRNLEEKGIMFNADDVSFEDEEDEEDDK